VHAFCHAVPGGWHAMGVMLSAAGSLRWLRDAMGGGASFAEHVDEAAAWQAGVEGLFFLPTWRASARRTPTRTPAARSSAWGCAMTAAP
jgi:xylulokinase